MEGSTLTEERSGSALVTVDDRQTVEQVYESILKVPSDIQDHLPILKQLASECRTVAEFGTRGALSTIALAAGYPEKVISLDIDPMWTQRALLLNLLQKPEPPPGRWNAKIEARCGDSLKVLLEPVDMIFIDTLHNFEQLRSELKRHGNQARRWLVFHDTVSFGYKDETGEGCGLRAAIRWFQERNLPKWQMIADDKRGSGLIVLQAYPHGGFPPFLGASVFDGPKENLE